MDINELINEIESIKIKEYVIWFSNDDNIRINIRQDTNRPNNPDDYELISEYVFNNYGHVVYEIIELDTLENISI